MKLKSGLQPLPRTFAANVAVILLIDAVKFRQLRVVIVQRTGNRVLETIEQRAAVKLRLSDLMRSTSVNSALISRRPADTALRDAFPSDAFQPRRDSACRIRSEHRQAPHRHRQPFAWHRRKRTDVPRAPATP